jgi:hypothetical protein
MRRLPASPYPLFPQQTAAARYVTLPHLPNNNGWWGVMSEQSASQPGVFSRIWDRISGAAAKREREAMAMRERSRRVDAETARAQRDAQIWAAESQQKHLARVVIQIERERARRVDAEAARAGKASQRLALASQMKHQARQEAQIIEITRERMLRVEAAAERARKSSEQLAQASHRKHLARQEALMRELSA